MKVVTINLKDRPDRKFGMLGALRHAGFSQTPLSQDFLLDHFHVVRPFDSREYGSISDVICAIEERSSQYFKGVIPDDMPHVAMCWAFSFVKMLNVISRDNAEADYLFLIDDIMIRPDWTFQQVRGLLTYARSVLGLDARIIQLHDCFKPYTKVDRSLGDPVQIFGVGVGGSADQGLIFTNAGASEFLRLIMSGVIPFTYPDRMVESIREFAPALNEKCLFTLNPVVEPMMFDWGNSMTTNEITVSYKKVR